MTRALYSLREMEAVLRIDVQTCFIKVLWYLLLLRERMAQGWGLLTFVRRHGKLLHELNAVS